MVWLVEMTALHYKPGGVSSRCTSATELIFIITLEHYQIINSLKFLISLQQLTLWLSHCIVVGGSMDWVVGNLCNWMIKKWITNTFVWVTWVWTTNNITWSHYIFFKITTSSLSQFQIFFAWCCRIQLQCICTLYSCILQQEVCILIHFIVSHLIVVAYYTNRIWNKGNEEVVISFLHSDAYWQCLSFSHFLHFAQTEIIILKGLTSAIMCV